MQGKLPSPRELVMMLINCYTAQLSLPVTLPGLTVWDLESSECCSLECLFPPGVLYNKDGQGAHHTKTPEDGQGSRK